MGLKNFLLTDINDAVVYRSLGFMYFSGKGLTKATVASYCEDGIKMRRKRNERRLRSSESILRTDREQLRSLLAKNAMSVRLCALGRFVSLGI